MKTLISTKLKDQCLCFGIIIIGMLMIVFISYNLLYPLWEISMDAASNELSQIDYSQLRR